MCVYIYIYCTYRAATSASWRASEGQAAEPSHTQDLSKVKKIENERYFLPLKKKGNKVGCPCSAGTLVA